jgi:hypothetical protein
LTFYIATRISSIRLLRFFVTIGALFGGCGAGVLWTAQGAYFTRSAQLHSRSTSSLIGSSSSSEDSTSKLASIFAFIYLSSEVGLRGLLTVLSGVVNLSWSNIFALYSLVATISTVLMFLVQELPEEDIVANGTMFVAEMEATTSDTSRDVNESSSIWYKATAAWRLLVSDPKMKYMIGLNAIFGPFSIGK